MAVILIFVIAFFFSFIGSIPPATINLTVLQLGLELKTRVAIRLALAASVMEYPYALIAVKFERLITSSPVIVQNMHLVVAMVMLTLGGINLWPGKKQDPATAKFSNSGFRKGLLLGILNPLAIPYWIGITAYLKAQGWIDLTTALSLQVYLIGIVLGAFVLLLLLAKASKALANTFKDNIFLKKFPGVVLLCLGLYALVRYVLSFS